MPTPSGFPTSEDLQNAQKDVEHLGRVVNSEDAQGNPIASSTNRTGGTNKTLDALQAEYQSAIQAAGGVPLGTWAAGVTYNAYNEYLVYNGIPYKPAPDTTLPYTTQGSDPTDGPDAGSVVPFAEVQASDLVTVREDLLGPGTGLYMGDDGDTVKVGDTIPAGTTHLRVDIGGSPAIVAMSPTTSGSVTTISDIGATIGGVNINLLGAVRTQLDKISALSTPFPINARVEINGSEFVAVQGGDFGGLYLGTLPNGNKLRHVPLNATRLTEVDTSDFEIESGSDIASWLTNAAGAGYGRVKLTEDFTVNSSVDLTGIYELCSDQNVTLTVDDANGNLASDTDGFNFRGIRLVKSGELSSVTFLNHLLMLNGDNCTVDQSSFIGQHSGLKIAGDNFRVQQCQFSDGVFHLYIDESASGGLIDSCYFTRGQRQYTEGEQQGDGIKISGQDATTGNHKDIIISNNIFYDMYRDCVDAYTGARRLVISGNLMVNWGAHAMDIKARATDSGLSEDGKPIMQYALVEGNMIWKDQLRPDFDTKLSAVVMQMIGDNSPESEDDVRELGMNGLMFTSNNVSYRGKGSFISLVSTYGAIVSDNFFNDLGDIERIVSADNSWHMKFSGNTIRIADANTSRIFGFGTNKALVSDNKFIGMSYDTTGDFKLKLKDNEFSGEGKVSNCIYVNSDNTSITGNSISDCTNTALYITNTAKRCRMENNEIRDCAAIFGHQGGVSENTYHCVRNNIAFGSGTWGPNSLGRVTSNGGIAANNEALP